jgi:hypothetical protein
MYLENQQTGRKTLLKVAKIKLALNVEPTIR